MHYFSDKYKEWIIYACAFEDGNFGEPKEVFFEEYDIDRSRLSNAFSSHQFRSSTQKDLVISKDSSHVAFVNVIPANRYNKDDLLTVVVWNQFMEIQWRATYDFKFGDKDFEQKEAVVSNDGDVYFLASVDKKIDLNGKPISLKSKNLPRYVYNIYKLTEDELLEKNIDLGKGNAVVDAGLFIEDDNTGQVYLGGFYTTDDRKSRLKGVFFGTGSDDLETTDYHIHDFDNDFLSGLERKRAIKNDKGLSYNYNIKNLLRFDDGTVGFIAENEYITEQFNNTDRFNTFGRGINNGVNAFGAGGFNNNRILTYHSNEIVIPRFSREGNLLSMEKIDKTYRSENPYYTTYTLATVGNKSYLIFNDRKTNKEAKAIKKKGRRFTDLVVIDESGFIEHQETLFSNKEIELPFTPYLSAFSDRYFIIGSSVGKKYSFGTIELK